MIKDYSLKKKLFVLISLLGVYCKASDNKNLFKNVNHKRTASWSSQDSDSSIRALQDYVENGSDNERVQQRNFSQRSTPQIVIPRTVSPVQSEKRFIKNKNSEIIIGVACATIGFGLVLLGHTFNSCPGEHCIWTKGVTWY